MRLTLILASLLLGCTHDPSGPAVDADGDLFLSTHDCDDSNPAINPNGVETCDGVDENCDGQIDEDVGSPFHADSDGDGFGAFTPQLACEQPAGFVVDATDCDDTNASNNPVADERCDGVDNNCDGWVDDHTAVDQTTWYQDIDRDGAGDATVSVIACDQPFRFTDNDVDCNDDDGEVSPFLAEFCDSKDNDCDGEINEAGSEGKFSWYADGDMDGWGDPADVLLDCDQPEGYVSSDRDCDPVRADINPGASEVCDGAATDENCDGSFDESGALGEPTWYADDDEDGYGTPDAAMSACTQPSGYVANSDDCDDLDPVISPAASEACDDADVDENCNGFSDDDDTDVSGGSAFFLDSDADGYGDPAGEITRCDGGVEEGYSSNEEDCDDSDGDINPDGTEICDGADNDCNGTVDEGFELTGTYFPDEDDDGFGDPDGVTIAGCMSPLGYRLDNTDCDDGDSTVHPYAWEDTTNGVDDDCDGGTDLADTSTLTAGPQTDDSGTAVTLTTISFPFCGTDYTTAYMQSNGRVTFGSSDTDYSETVAEFDDDRAIAAVWDDLNPASSYGGDTWTIQYPDAVGFYWVGVREISAVAGNDFSVVLFDDGRILLQYGAIGPVDGIAGISCAPGSAPAESDLTADMDNIVAGRWGIGSPTATMYYEDFTVGAANDLDNRVLRLCGNVDSSTDNCGE